MVYLYSRFPFFHITKIFSSFHHFLCDCSANRLSSSGSSDYVPLRTTYRFGGTRSVLSWETIVHYPRYKLRGQIRLKDTTFFVGLRSTFCFLIVCLYYRFVSFIFFVSVF